MVDVYPRMIFETRRRILVICCGLIIFISAYFMTVSNHDECTTTIPRRDNYVVDKNIDNLWHDEYVRGYHKIICKCPTINYNTIVYYNDEYVSYSSSPWSTSPYMSFTSCNGKILALVIEGNYFKTKIEGKEVFVSYLFKNENGNTIGYSDARYMQSDIIQIKDINGSIVSVLEKSDLGTGSTWTIDITNQTHILSDPSILFALVGTRAFSESIDLCNIVWTLVVIFTFYSMLIVLYKYCSPGGEGEN